MRMAIRKAMLGIALVTLYLIGNAATGIYSAADRNNVTPKQPIVKPNGIIRPGLGGGLRQCGSRLFLVEDVDPNCRLKSDIVVFEVATGPPIHKIRITGPDGNPVPYTFISNHLSFHAVAGSYEIRVKDDLGKQDCSIGFLPPVCSTLTQSDWGSRKPRFEGEKRLKTIGRLMKGADPLIVGLQGRSLLFLSDSKSCIVDRLPASGSVTALPEGLGDARIDAGTCQTLPALPLNSQGTFANELLGQAIALELNTRLEPRLFFLELSHKIVTQKALPPGQLDPGPDGQIGTPDDPVQIIMIPVSVLKAIKSLGFASPEEEPPSVFGLLHLANLALTGTPNLGGATIQEINSAVDGINRAFNGGQVVIGRTSAGPPSHLKIAIDPNPVPQASLPCSDMGPAWNFNVTISEDAGVGITITEFGFAVLNPEIENRFIAEQFFDGDTFAGLFERCSITGKSKVIGPNSAACGSYCLRGSDFKPSAERIRQIFGNGAEVMMYLFGFDDNGNTDFFLFSGDKISLVRPTE